MIVVAIGVAFAAVSLDGQGTTWRLDRAVVIPGDGGSSFVLSDIADLTVSRRGDVFVADRLDQTVAVFDARGRFLRSFGRRGAGPGEFGGLRALGWLGDTLVTIDRPRYRVSLWSSAGRLLRDVTVRGPMLPLSSRPTPPAAMLAGGSFLGIPSTGRRSSPALPLLLLDSAGGEIGRLGSVSNEHAYGIIRTGHSIINFPYPFRSDDVVAVAPGGGAVVVVTRRLPTAAGAARFDVTSIRPTADTIFHEALDYRPLPIGQRVADSVRERMARIFLLLRTRSDEAMRLARDSLHLPRYMPPIDRVFVGTNGDVWLARPAASYGTDDLTVLDGRTGRPMATLHGPHGFVPYAAGAGMLWGVSKDEFDVPSVVGYRILKQ